MSVEEVLADFPDLTAEDIRACLAFAAAAKGSFGCASAAIAQRGPAVWRAGWQGGKEARKNPPKPGQAIRGTIRHDRTKSGKTGRSNVSSAHRWQDGREVVVGHRKV